MSGSISEDEHFVVDTVSQFGWQVQESETNVLVRFLQAGDATYLALRSLGELVAAPWEGKQVFIREFLVTGGVRAEGHRFRDVWRCTPAVVGTCKPWGSGVQDSSVCQMCWASDPAFIVAHVKANDRKLALVTIANVAPWTKHACCEIM